MPRPKVNGFVVDFHCHLLAARHAPAWFEAADHYGIDCFVTMTPLEEAAALQRDGGSRLQFFAVGAWGQAAAAMSDGQWVDDFLVRLDSFYNLGSRVVKFHGVPGTLADVAAYSSIRRCTSPIFREIVARKMAVMTHIGDRRPVVSRQIRVNPRIGRKIRYPRRALPNVGSPARRIPRRAVGRGAPRRQPRGPCPAPAPARPFPRPVARHQRYPLDGARRSVASKARSLPGILHPQPAAAFCLAAARSSADDRGFDFLASRFWTHRKLWGESAYANPKPIADPDLAESN